jgi:hypothetical protein
MAGRRQLMVQPPVRTYGLGSTSTADLYAIYPGSPVYSGEINDETVTETFMNVVMSGEINDGGHTFGSVNIDYQAAPDLNEVETGGGGLPATPYAPNVAVAPEDPHNPAGIPAEGAEATARLRGGGGAFTAAPGTGGNVAANPKDTSTAISQLRIGEYILGKGSTT